MKLNDKNSVLARVFASGLGLVIIAQLLRILLTQANYQLVYNHGIAFGLLGNAAIFALVLNILAFSVIIYLVVEVLAKPSNRLQQFAFSLLLAGGLSNLYERLIYGYIVDYFVIRGLTVFNLADVMVDLAIAILLIFALYEWRNKHQHNRSDD